LQQILINSKISIPPGLKTTGKYSKTEGTNVFEFPVVGRTQGKARSYNFGLSRLALILG
jgi:hypothetical protein